MNQTNHLATIRAIPAEVIPPLETGDHLSRDEFERRYDAMPNLKKAELIEGVVYMPSPMRANHHGEPQGDINTWLGVYKWATPGLMSPGSASVRMDKKNELQPDSQLLIKSECGGQSKISDDDYIELSPELIAEVAASTASIELNKKFVVYQRNGVREYIVDRVLDQELDWFVLRDGKFERQLPDVNGLLKSTVFPGLWLDPSALISGDTDRLSAVLQQGIASPEHAEFVAKLQSAAK